MAGLSIRSPMNGTPFSDPSSTAGPDGHSRAFYFAGPAFVPNNRPAHPRLHAAAIASRSVSFQAVSFQPVLRKSTQAHNAQTPAKAAASHGQSRAPSRSGMSAA